LRAAGLPAKISCGFDVADARQTRADPGAGRLVVIGVAILGLGAVIAYAVVQSNERTEAMARAQPTESETPKAEAAPSIAELVARSDEARKALDTATLVRVQKELEAAAKSSSRPPLARRARRAQLDAITSLAVEATLRSATLGDEKAREQAAEFASQGQALANALDAELEPAELVTARARITLAQGRDVIDEHPLVLLSTFGDRELQHAVLSEPLWRPTPGNELDDEERAGLVQALEEVSDPTGLEQLLLALALDAEGESERAKALARDALATAPRQSLAQGLLDRFDRGTMLAVADPQPIPVGIPSAPETPPVAETPPLVETPTPSVEPSAPSKPKKPKSSGSKPKKRLGPAELTTEGCKLVRSGKAQQGFSLLQRAFDLNPRDTKVTQCMAEAHLKLGRLPSARAMVERVLRSSGKNKRALLLAAKIEDKMGAKRAATDYYRRVLAIDPDHATAKAYVDKNG